MDEEKKFEEIKKRVEAVIAARKLAEQAYRTYPLEYRKEYLVFRNTLLVKFGLRKKFKGY